MDVIRGQNPLAQHRALLILHHVVKCLASKRLVPDRRLFHTALYNVFSNHSLSINIRWMAILCFKNGVDKYWRKNAPNGIADDEKEFLRQRLIVNFEEPVNQLAIQLAALIAKIARYDWPREWRSLIPTLLDVIRGQNPLAQHRALLILHHVVKCLASKRFSS